MGSLNMVLFARTLIVLAGICAYVAYRLLPTSGFAGLNGLCFAALAFGCVAAAIGCSVDSYDEWDFRRECRVYFGRG